MPRLNWCNLYSSVSLIGISLVLQRRLISKAKWHRATSTLGHFRELCLQHNISPTYLNPSAVSSPAPSPSSFYQFQCLWGYCVPGFFLAKYDHGPTIQGKIFDAVRKEWLQVSCKERQESISTVWRWDKLGNEREDVCT